jgi:AcrR family transcriptional regulator
LELAVISSPEFSFEHFMARTPSSEAHEKVLSAAGELIAKHGVNGFTMDSIARTSGVSKATIYKHWPDKEALCLETAKRLAGVIPSFGSESPREDLVALLQHLARRKKAPTWSKIWPRLMTYSIDNPEFGRKLRQFLVEPQRLQLKRILASAASRGELVPDLDIDFSLSLLAGPIFHCAMLKSDVSRSFVEHVVNAFWNAHSLHRSQVSRDL